MAQWAMKGREGVALGLLNPSPEALGQVTHKELKMWTKIRLQTGDREGEGEKEGGEGGGNGRGGGMGEGKGKEERGGNGREEKGTERKREEEIT